MSKILLIGDSHLSLGYPLIDDTPNVVEKIKEFVR